MAQVFKEKGINLLKVPHHLKKRDNSIAKKSRSFGNKLFFHRRTSSNKAYNYDTKSAMSINDSIGSFGDKSINHNRSANNSVTRYSQMLNPNNKIAKSVNFHLRSSRISVGKTSKISIKKPKVTHEDRLHNAYRFLKYKRSKVSERDLPPDYLGKF